jgi:hypothetical protein
MTDARVTIDNIISEVFSACSLYNMLMRSKIQTCRSFKALSIINSVEFQRVLISEISSSNGSLATMHCW